MLRPGLETRSPVTRRGVRRRPDGAARTVHCRRTGPRRRSLHPAPLCRLGREGASADRGEDKAALAIRKASGAQLGNPTNIREAGQLGRAALLAAADAHAQTLLPALRAIRAEGAITIRTITRAPNERQIPAQRGSRWHVSSVANLLTRAQRVESAV